MDAGLSITPLSIAMFVGCFLLGFIPLLFRFSERSVHFISILGAGLLCGTALAITIPEGVGLLQASWTHRHVNATSTERAPSPQLWIGVALTLGFAFMFVVDQLGSYLSLCGQTTPNRGAITATLGLVIHAAADGFALGAVVATGQITVQIIVFLAVILHKASSWKGFGTRALAMARPTTSIKTRGALWCPAVCTTFLSTPPSVQFMRGGSRYGGFQCNCRQTSLFQWGLSARWRQPHWPQEGKKE
ncbi:zinc transporter ZIP9 isoform X3 [Phyllopteryx taeniolatus]|uniref:zinc transporter ZIP9 isoform X3 n=1 Tax=Phyllopteryx taeniolatus TaxID=161469 RepID=UPI002AD1FDC2|nr:zinc transporter ZIP9 isoform X3 [Phyllopteryx taeniolatus]